VVTVRQQFSPWTLLRSLDPTARSAIANARLAAAEIGRSIEERHALMAGLDELHGGVVSPGLEEEPEETGERHLVVLTTAECRRLLATRRLGRLAFVNRADQPLIVPVNYSMDGRDVLIATGPGPKLQAAIRRDVVAFEVDVIEEETGRGWSVVVSGRAKREPRAVRSLHGGDRTEPHPWAPGPRLDVIRISPSRLTGRWLTGYPAEPATKV
jgi:nitroimidazol reductase NimA-like FMN-containing flavoprotein (pyridoxamine 5'-phosphate oxidase superfamily)